MKKIDIITFQNAHNYGATLQTYALQRFLNDKNYDANDINYKDKAIGDQYKIFRVNTKNKTNEQNSQVNYVTIKSKTKVRDIKQDGDYTIKDNNNIANEIKRAPSSVNTNAEKDSNSYIATGDILQDNNNTYIVITLGDLSSNGDVRAADLVKLRKSLVELTKLTKLQELVADTNQNGRVNVSDLLKERKIIVGME